MVTVSNLLTRRAFAELNLISDESGLENAVSETGIFDWESPVKIRQTFRPGAFVVTTLSGIQNDPQHAIEGLKTLIDIKVSAIALKTVFIDTFPDEIIEYANEQHVPLFLFRDTFLDDIIYTTKDLLASRDNNRQRLERVRALLYEDNYENQAKLIKDINPFFQEKCICCTCIPKADNIKTALRECINAIFKNDDIQYNKADDPRFIVFGNNCILLICTDVIEGGYLKTRFKSFIEDLGYTSRDFRMGISNEHPIDELKSSIEESIQSAYYALIGNENFIKFDEVGVNQILIPNMRTKWVTIYYNRIHEKLSDYDSSHTSNLHETLLAYIECDGDINLTASRLFQHSNTVRYRLGKIKSLLGIESSPDAYMQMSIYAILHKLYSFFDGENMF